MKKLASFGIVAVIALLSCAGIATSAQAYPEHQINVSVNHQVVYGGSKFTATADSDVDCAWTLEWNGDSRSQTGSPFTTTYKTPKVKKSTDIPLHAKCVYQTTSGRTSGRAAATATWTETVMITVLPRGKVSPPTTGGGNGGNGNGGSDLPNTGGPRLWIALAGLACLVGGIATVARARRDGVDA